MTDFARLMNDYFVKYLIGQKGSGNNTLKTTSTIQKKV